MHTLNYLILFMDILPDDPDEDRWIYLTTVYSVVSRQILLSERSALYVALLYFVL